jgi:ribonuclease HII
VPFVVGIDEAGYGPLLGPLVVGATLWHVTPTCGPEAQPITDPDFWQLLSGAVCRTPARGDSRLHVNDSKQVFDRHKGIATLERPVLAFATACGLTCGTLSEFLGALGTPIEPNPAGPPWYLDLSHSLPVDRVRSAHAAAAERLRGCLDTSGVRCCGLFAQAVTEPVFNDRVAKTRNKAAVLVEQVLRLIQRTTEQCRDQDVQIHVDRLGGRMDYRPLLQTAFPQRHLHVLQATEECSRYRLASQASDWTVDFSVEADQHYLPVALASMVAKYVRELLMLRFNAYWHELLPELRPTAGYYKDALRFIADIQPALSQAGLAPEQFVRQR